MTYDAMCAAALLVHETEYRLRGESYATAAEMEHIRNDPLAYYDSIRPELTIATGYIMSHRTPVQATVADMLDAAQVIHESWRYIYQVQQKRLAEGAQ